MQLEQHEAFVCICILVNFSFSRLVKLKANGLSFCKLVLIVHMVFKYIHFCEHLMKCPYVIQYIHFSEYLMKETHASNK